MARRTKAPEPVDAPRPTALSHERRSEILAAAAGPPGAPVLGPPAPGAPVVNAGGAGTWQSDRRITGLFSADSARNSWLLVQGVGWKQLAATSDGGLLAMTAIGRAARDAGLRVDYREQADGRIYELYAW